MTPAPVITLLTDFGLEDPYVGVMKAVILRHCPHARIIDLTHAIPAYDRRAAAFWLERVVAWFAPGTVHVGVVDPGVGSERRPLCVAAQNQFFVGPDNGIFAGLFAKDPGAVGRVIESDRLGFELRSRTFHGRDLFAPAAALLAAGAVPFDALGPVAPELCGPVLLAARTTDSGWSGEVVLVDHFGNALTNIERPQSSGGGPAERFEVWVGPQKLPIYGTYADGSPGEAFALFGSFGTLEVAVREGHAARVLAIQPGSTVELRRSPWVPVGLESIGQP